MSDRSGSVVYGERLDRSPLRFVLADDPGAGKTVMAGLYIKELTLRGDLERCLVVAPGGLVDQWQEELLDEFGLRFEGLTRDLIAAQLDQSVGPPRDQRRSDVRGAGRQLALAATWHMI